NGIVVAAASNDVVTIRNLSIDGLLGNGSNSGNAGINGIRFTSGAALHIDHCKIFGFNNFGIDVELTPNPGPNGAGPQVTVIDSIIADNAKAGFYASGTSVPYVRVSIDRSSFDNDGTGVQAGDYARITVRNSE